MKPYALCSAKTRNSTSGSRCITNWISWLSHDTLRPKRRYPRRWQLRAPPPHPPLRESPTELAVRTLIETRHFLSVLLSMLFGTVLFYRMPFPAQNNLLQFVWLEKPYLFYGIRWAYTLMMFSTPYIGFSLVFSLAYIFVVRRERSTVCGQLPPYPDVESHDKLFLVVGELHHPRRPEPSDNPRWLVIPERGLFTGLAIFGAIGSGKTSCCMLPFADQILSYRARDRERRVGGLVLEVKGDFCDKVRKLR